MHNILKKHMIVQHIVIFIYLFIYFSLFGKNVKTYAEKHAFLKIIIIFI